MPRSKRGYSLLIRKRVEKMEKGDKNKKGPRVGEMCGEGKERRPFTVY